MRSLIAAEDRSTSAFTRLEVAVGSATRLVDLINEAGSCNAYTCIYQQLTDPMNLRRRLS